jgi:hypothetical protein
VKRFAFFVRRFNKIILLLFIFFILSSTSFSGLTPSDVAQGAKVSTASGLVVSQSIGQQSMAGSYSKMV